MATRSNEIAAAVLEATHNDRHLPAFGKLPDSDLLMRFEDACKKLSLALSEGDEAMLARHYESLSLLRHLEGIPLHEVIWAALLFKQQLLRYAQEHCCEQTAYDLYTEVELERLVNGVFDKVVFYLVRGYERALERESTQERWKVAATL
ncbi:MAG: hypothetical protein WD733_00535 [Bryobacterales bacterium]